MKKVDVKVGILDENDREAAANRTLFREAGVRVLNLIGSPGSGKTTLLERTIPALDGRVLVVEGDVETSIDAERIGAAGADSIQLNTHGGCHLSAKMVREALSGETIAISRSDRGACPRCALADYDLVVIENVGNLVCPAAFDLGEDAVVAVVSLAEGPEKPIKYPALFRRAHACVVTKVDLAPHMDADLDVMRENLRRVNEELPVFEINSRAVGFDREGEAERAWVGWFGGDDR